MINCQVNNRHGLMMQVDVFISAHPAGLVFIQHGMSGYKAQPQIQALLETYRQRHNTIVLFDATNSFNTSEGDLADFTVTTHLHDLEDIIAWTTMQDFYREPFSLAGVSAGGFATGFFAAHHGHRIAHLVLLAPAVSGDFLTDAYQQRDPAAFAAYRTDGYFTKTDPHNPSRSARVPWAFLEDFCTYDLLSHGAALTMPVLIIVGEQDATTPVDQIQALFDELATDKTLHILPGAGHTFLTSDESHHLSQTLGHWLDQHTGI